MLINGDARLIPLADNSVHCVITSPPYYGLRDYGTATWDGGNPSCIHVVGNQVQDNKAIGAITSGVRPGADASHCLKCGARRIDAQIGLEQSPAEYVEQIVSVFREIWRVLRPEGTCWLVIGDSYASTPPGNKTKGVSGKSTLHGVNGKSGQYRETLSQSVQKKRNTISSDLKPKDLIGIPWRVAFALQADGWWLRSDIIWDKPNPMPESVTDRPTKAHEYIFLLTKSARYFYDSEAVRENISESTLERWKGIPVRKNASRQAFQVGGVQGESSMGVNPSGRNRRSVWAVTTEPYSGAHFATFPKALIEPMVLAGTSAHGCCSGCGKPWVRLVQKPDMSERPRRSEASKSLNEWQGATSAGGQYQKWRNQNPDQTVGWEPTCKCDADVIPCVVLDPFCGSGTVGEVCRTLPQPRRFIGIDLSMKYLTENALPRAEFTQSADAISNLPLFSGSL